MQSCMIILTSPHQDTLYRNCCLFALAPACSGWGQGLQAVAAAATDTNKPATAIVSAISPRASPPPLGCQCWFCSLPAQTVCFHCPSRVRTQTRFLTQDFVHSECKLLPVSWYQWRKLYLLLPCCSFPKGIAYSHLGSELCSQIRSTDSKMRLCITGNGDASQLDG